MGFVLTDRGICYEGEAVNCYIPRVEYGEMDRKAKTLVLHVNYYSLDPREEKDIKKLLEERFGGFKMVFKPNY